MDSNTRKYLAKIGKKGGQKSRRTLIPEEAKLMVKVREARKAFKKFYTMCFWHLKPDLHINKNNLSVIVNGLKNCGNREAYFAAVKLCR